MRRAITRGEVDAFVVGPGGSGRVLLLANAYQRYRQLVERMQQGAVTATANGHILFANQRFSDMLGVPLAQLYTAPLESYVGVSDRARLSAFLMVSARDSRIEVELDRRDGASIPVRLSLASFADGYASLLVTDLRPLQWPSMAVDALDSIRTSLEKLNQDLAGDAAGARRAAQHQRGNQRLGAHDRRDDRRRRPRDADAEGVAATTGPRRRSLASALQTLAMPQGVSRAVIEVLLDRVSQGAGTLSPEGQLTYANQRLASMLGVNRGQLIGKPLVELAAEADREMLSPRWRARATPPPSAASRLHARQRRRRDLQALLTFAPLGHGQLSCIVTKAED